MTTQGERLKELRFAFKWTQDDFAKKMGFSCQYVSKLEKDKNILNNDKLQKLLTDYNVNLNWLIGGIGEMFIAPKFEDVKSEILAEVEKMLKDRGIK